jgi:hypothetical protein
MLQTGTHYQPKPSIFYTLSQEAVTTIHDLQAAGFDWCCYYREHHLFISSEDEYSLKEAFPSPTERVTESNCKERHTDNPSSGDFLPTYYPVDNQLRPVD